MVIFSDFIRLEYAKLAKKSQFIAIKCRKTSVIDFETKDFVQLNKKNHKM